MIMIDFPASPTTGQQFTAVGVTWTWDGTKWTASGLGTSYLPIAGGTLTGPLTLVSDPTAALQPATKHYVDVLPVAGSNRIINGDMRIDQRNGGAIGNAVGYTVDRWVYAASLAAKGNWQRNIGVAGPSGFPYYLGFQATSAYALLVGDYFRFNQIIEADMVSDFQWGTANAQPVTLSFWVYCTLTGTFGGSIINAASNRSYPFTYSIPAVTWTKIVLAIPGDTGGTWVMSGAAAALYVNFGLGVGATYSGAAGAWASGYFMSATGAVSVVSTNNAWLGVTGVKLEIGSVATPYNRQSLAKSMADCQRYYQVGTLYMAGWSGVLSQNVSIGSLKTVSTRAAATMAVLSDNSSGITGLILSDNLGMFYGSGSSGGVGPVSINVNFSASAEL
jgi:hypothetical protein